jgi:DNA-binding CsgD family transcriptional regulator
MARQAGRIATIAWTRIRFFIRLDHQAAIRGAPSSRTGANMSIDDLSLAAFRALQNSRPGRKPKLTEHQQRETLHRLAAGESQRSIARHFRVSQATVWRLESGLAEFLRDTNQLLNHAA